MVTDAMRAAIPEPLYGCKTQSCAEDKSVRASELRWRKDGYYCGACVDGGVTLAAWQQAWPSPGGALGDAMPKAVYPCACHECAVEVSYPANMLNWCRDGFYCEECIEADDIALGETPDAEYEARHDGPSLAEVLVQAPAAVPVEAPPLRYLGDTS